MTDTISTLQDQIQTKENESLLRNSVSHLEAYRKKQAEKLKMRLNVLKQAAIKKHGSIDNIKTNEGTEPIESKNDVNIIERLINLETFVTIPVFARNSHVYNKCDNSSTNKCDVLTHVYTLGMWYYWGLPEIVIRFDKPVIDYHDVANILINLIHDELFFKFKNIIVNESDELIHIDYESVSKNVDIKLDKFDLEFTFKRISGDQYMDVKAGYMMWFYMYYMDAINDSKGNPKMYPVYQLEITQDTYINASKKIINKLKTTIENISNNTDVSLSSEESENDENDENDSIVVSTNVKTIETEDYPPFEIKKKYW